MRTAIFACPSNPYYRLFQWAGCSYQDLAAAVHGDGLEATLESLRKAGGDSPFALCRKVTIVYFGIT